MSDMDFTRKKGAYSKQEKKNKKVISSVTDDCGRR